KRMGALGANLYLWDINRAGLDSLEVELAGVAGSSKSYMVDLSERLAIYETAEKVLAACDHIDILINDAGIVSGKPLLESTDEEVLRTFNVNTLALFWTAHAFLPGMIRRNSGHIVTVSSAGGIVGTSRLVDYCSSKFAAVGFDESLRLELKRQKVNVNTTVICPYYIDTGMFKGVKTRFPWLLPILKPEHVADKIVKAILKNRKKVVMPPFVMVSYPLRLLPTPWFDFLIDFFGINKSMDEFTGRSKGD
ncbi:MAG: SDR family oxidoreductase, partial [Calditrichia bacterium]